MPARCSARFFAPHFVLSIALFLAAFVTAVPFTAAAAEFRSAADNAVILYDAPSTKGRKLFIVNRGYPLEVVVQVEGWIKVRDAAGGLSWAESKLLDNTRNVLVRAASVTLRQKPAEDAPAVAEVRRDVLLELVERPPGNWIQVRHRDGSTGFVRAADVWGG
ncbi:MAG: SH3 domain-containing protein [Burkholderiales bacterium]|nr:SH3 domain-containing protein [Burkholderiales bacterium]